MSLITNQSGFTMAQEGGPTREAGTSTTDSLAAPSRAQPRRSATCSLRSMTAQRPQNTSRSASKPMPGGSREYFLRPPPVQL